MSIQGNLQNRNKIALMRLFSQHLAETKFASVKDIVGWMGAMQAQDYIMCKWAVGIRLPGSTDQFIETAMNKGEVIRTHLLRPTWHLVSADDIYWMLDLTAPQIRSILKSRDKRLELTEKIYNASNKILEKALRDGNSLPLEELKTKMGKAKIATDENRMSHLLLRAELDGLICNGKREGGKITYALLEERVPKPRQLTREEALARLASKYFTSHCPATVQDFSWWSGLSLKDSKLGIDLIKKDFTSEVIDSQKYWISNSFSVPTPDKDSVYLLPAYDEFIISYKDRSAALPLEIHKSTISSNGIFRPVIVLNSKVIGLWKRLSNKDKVIVETALFKKYPKTKTKLIKEAADRYGRFLEKEIELKVKYS